MTSPKLPLYKATRRLILRPLEDQDYENWAQAYSCLHPPQNEWDEANWQDKELEPEKFRELLDRQETLRNIDKCYDFGVFRKEDGILVGMVHLMDISRGIFQNAYLGYRIYNNYWNQGYATEACKGVISLAFKELKLHRVEAGIAPANKRSLVVAQKIGLRREGLSKKRLKIDNKWIDLVIYAGTKEDF